MILEIGSGLRAKNAFRAFAGVAVAASLAACAAPADRSVKKSGPTLLERSTLPYKIAPLDQVRLRLPDGKRLDLMVSQDGTLIDLENTERQVEGMPVDAFRALLRRMYPNASEIEVVEFRPNRITVLGEVFHQIHSQLDEGPMRVMDAIASANGFTPLANKRRVKLVRQNAGQVEVYELDLREMMAGQNMSQNMLLKPGDVITVPRNFL